MRSDKRRSLNVVIYNLADKRRLAWLSLCWWVMTGVCFCIFIPPLVNTCTNCTRKPLVEMIGSTLWKWCKHLENGNLSADIDFSSLNSFTWNIKLCNFLAYLVCFSCVFLFFFWNFLFVTVLFVYVDSILGSLWAACAFLFSFVAVTLYFAVMWWLSIISRSIDCH